METEREKLVYLARLAEQAERYDGALLKPFFLSCFYRVLNLLFLDSWCGFVDLDSLHG